MNRQRGFTLVELLVVIAIISILAAIVVPRVTDAIGSARAAKAASEIRGAELAVTKMLADADKKGIDKFFAPGALYAAAMNNIDIIDKFYSDVFYELLKRGKEADLSDYGLGLVPTVRTKLGSVYMDIPMDPWGTNPYFFFAGPLKAADRYRFRCYRENPVDPEQPYIYTEGERQRLNLEVSRGNPPGDNLYGYPCPKDLPVYIFSYGADEVSNQRVVNNAAIDDMEHSGGDDINNWDNAGGWAAFY